MLLGTHHASITTPDIDRLADFYCNQLGFELVMVGAWDGDAPVCDLIYGLEKTSVRMAMLKLGGSFLELFEFIHPVGKRSDAERAVSTPGFTHVAVQVTDIEAEYARLVAEGVRFHCPPQEVPGLCKATYGRDPEGNIFELLEPAPRGAFDPAAPAGDQTSLREQLALTRSFRR
jgi:catechol 2,3-dioxygenase-like lactoylglutathione lyase family enzyme